MQTTGRIVGSCVVASLALLGSSTPAAAARKPISGKLTKADYTVIALAANGTATSDRARTGAFRLRPRAGSVTLHLRAKDGTYAGPIVVGRERKRAVLGVREGARLGRVRVRRGYARVARRLAKRWVDRTRTARARNGVPIGAGRFGRVRSRRTHGGVPGDRDLDGIADPLDVDDDGDLILDNIDRSSRARSAQLDPGKFIINSGLGFDLRATVNANATALTSAQVDAGLASAGGLKLTFVLGDLVELDCRGLIYCSSGGTGRLLVPGAQMVSDLPPFPGDPFGPFDPDGDGFGTLQPQPKAPNTMVLHHGATTAQIRTGDVLIDRVTTRGVETQYPATVQYVFATIPALVAYDDGQGNSATISYPVTTASPFFSEPLPVVAGLSGDVVVTLTFWRPQRRPIPPEAGDWIDIGRLDYAVGVRGADASCTPPAFSESDPNLTPVEVPVPPPGQQPVGGFTDLAADRPASPANTFTYTLNLTQCLASLGISFNPGESREFDFGGNTSAVGGGAGQTLSFKRE